ncbi:DoxX family membrane protein [Isoptericola sediminis]|uniref:DoxX family membrane protein n=1 Tax=Isoptericola sediminis TaxID=2733572 RepID=A0A849JX12_9MICO|nr:DoxX family membrane protein [Isoptericola sediminis]NNU27852.1 DoxX family membrane protein [Isoptericola sediminis]
MLLRRLARPLLAVPFIYDGVSTALRPAEHTDAAREGADTVTDTLGVDRLDDTQVALLVRAHGAVTAFAGLLLAVGRTPRTAALALAALTTPLAVVNQPFTSKGDERKEKTLKFVKNLGAIGATVIAGIDLEGRPGMSYRIAQKTSSASKSAQHAVESAEKTGKYAVRNAERTGRYAVQNAKRSATTAQKSASTSARRARKQVERDLRSTVKSARAGAKSARAAAEKAAAKVS